MPLPLALDDYKGLHSPSYTNHQLELQIIDGNFLPNQKSSAEEKLLYLTRFSKEPHLCPLTEKQKEICIQSQKTAKCTSRCLKTGIWATTALAIAPAITVGIPAIVKWVQLDPLNALYLAIGVTVITATVNLFNFLATGTLPDRSATANTNREYEVEKSAKTYEDMGCRLIEISQEDPTLAQSIAAKLDISRIKNALKSLVSDEIAEDHCVYLEHAKTYILKQRLDPDAPRSLRQTVIMLKSIQIHENIEPFHRL